MYGKRRTFAASLGALLIFCLVISLFSPVLTSADSTPAPKSGSATPSLSVDPFASDEGYSAVLYDNANGLPTSEANDIATTSEGFIWIGSYGGLIRYDGNTFERYDSTTGIASVKRLFADSQDRLWIGTNDSGLGVLDKGKLKIYNKDDGLASLSIRAIAEDGDGLIYVATTNGIDVVEKDGSLRRIDDEKIHGEYVRDLLIGPDNVLYGVTINGEIITIKDEKIVGFYTGEDLGVSNIHSVAPDPDASGYVYVGSKGSEVYHGKLGPNFRDGEKYSVAPCSYVNSIKKIGGNLFVCTDAGVAAIKNGKAKQLKGLPVNSSVEAVTTDYQGNLWFASSKQGVMKIVPNQFADVFEKYSLEPAVVNSTCLYDGALFVGTKSDGIIALKNGSEIQRIPISDSRSASGKWLGYTELLSMTRRAKIRSIVRDSQNRLWISSFGDNPLIRYDASDSKTLVFDVADGLPSNRVRTVIEAKDGSFIVACTDGVAIIKNDKVEKVFTEEDGLSNPEVLAVEEADNGDIVVGTDGGGLNVITPQGVVTRYGVEDGLGSDVVMRVKKDPEREIFWLVASNSLAYMTYDYEITSIKKFPYSNNFDVYWNDAGEIWVLASNGVYVVPAEELLANGEISPIFYGKDNGLPCIATSNSYSELRENGDLYISGSTGVAKVNIEKPFSNAASLKLAVPFVEADGEYIYPDDDGTITIPSDVRKLKIHAYVYNYSLENPLVSYRLEGFESESTTIKRSELAPLVYSNLKGGKYKFVMSVKDVRGEDGASVSIEVTKKKAFHETLWFKIPAFLFCLGLVAGAVTLYVRRRTRKYLEKEAEQKLLVREIVEAFAKVIDMKDKYTNGHSTRVAEYTAMLAKELGYDEETVEKYYNIALLHDIGKVGVPPEVLNKPGKLDDTEFNIIKSHSALGFNTLKNISILPELATGAGAHHERPDGKGYPKGLKGGEIPRVAQIIAVADTFDAMYSDRPYRKRMNFDKAVSIMKEVSGTQLTADVVEAFLRLVEQGEFRSPDDDGGGTTEDIDNIHKKFNRQKASGTDDPDKK